MQNAPILISVYNRLSHLQNCIESLRLNPRSIHSELFIVSDGPNKVADVKAVNEIRSYLPHITGFKKVTPIIREENLGSHYSTANEIENLLKKYGRLIFLEDDNIVSENFLDYINSALDYYDKDSSIFSISGYNYPVRMPNDYPFDIYKSRNFSAWGVGYWLDRWDKIDWSLPKLEEIENGTKARKALDSTNEHISALLIHCIKHNRIAGDAIISYHQYKNNLYSIFPVISKVRNVGNDGTGEHCSIDMTYTQQNIDVGSECRFLKDPPWSQEIAEILRRHFKIPYKTKTVWFMGRIIPPSIKKVLNKFRRN